MNIWGQLVILLQRAYVEWKIFPCWIRWGFSGGSRTTVTIWNKGLWDLGGKGLAWAGGGSEKNL